MIKVESIDNVTFEPVQRIKTEWPIVDDFFGGGLVAGMFYLFAGFPGAGKSTFLLQIAYNIAKQGKKVLYITGEEAIDEVRERADRIGALSHNIILSKGMEAGGYHVDIENVYNIADQVRPSVLIIDSMQMLYSNTTTGGAGGKKQVTACSMGLGSYCKKNNIALIIINQSTKNDPFAGFQSLQHITGCNMALNINEETGERLLYAKKNRKGDTSKKITFFMGQNGLYVKGHEKQYSYNINASGHVVNNTTNNGLLFNVCMLPIYAVVAPFAIVAGLVEGFTIKREDQKKKR